MIQLSKRLQAVAKLVTKGNRVADVGCDHGYIAIYLTEESISPYVVAMDVRPGPLDRAKKHIERAELSGKIETRISDGAEALKEGEVDTMICAGMGGRLVIQIIEAQLSKIRLMKELILQPQSDLHLVRKYLRLKDFITIAEDMVLEDGKYYPIMKVTPGAIGKSQELDQEIILSDYFGGLLLLQRHPVLLQYLDWKTQENKKIEAALRFGVPLTKKQMERLFEIEAEAERIEIARTYY